jgi:hypothetical protein
MKMLSIATGAESEWNSFVALRVALARASQASVKPPSTTMVCPMI